MSTIAEPKPFAIADAPRFRTSLFWSLYGVWFRHVRVYCTTLVANATPPILEPLIFFFALALGLAPHMKGETFDNLPYIGFIASGILVMSSMWTGVFETTHGTFVRITWLRTYDAMLSTHLTLTEVFVGELLFCATKGAVFSLVVMLVMLPFGGAITVWCLLIPLIGFATAYLFGAVGLIVTSYVKLINNFAFFHTGVISPMFFFSGTFFPVKDVENPLVWWVWFLLPLSHSVELSRACYKGIADGLTLAHIGMLVLYVILFHVIALHRIRKRIYS